MAYLLRTYTGDRWLEALTNRDQPLPADPVGDLKTQENKLSVWMSDGTDANVDFLTACIAASYKSPAEIYVFLVNEGALSRAGLLCEHSPLEGITRVKAANEQHHNIVGLSAVQLIQFANLLRNEAVSKPYTLQRYGELVSDLCRNGVVAETEVPDGARSYLKKHKFL